MKVLYILRLKNASEKLPFLTFSVIIHPFRPKSEEVRQPKAESSMFPSYPKKRENFIDIVGAAGYI